MQYQFNEHILILQQKLYQSEGIEWNAVEVLNNVGCLELIEHKQNGIIAMLDDECMLPKGNLESLAHYYVIISILSGVGHSAKFASRMYSAFSGSKHFIATPAHKNNNEFCIQHYAGRVVYSSSSFLVRLIFWSLQGI